MRDRPCGESSFAAIRSGASARSPSTTAPRGSRRSRLRLEADSRPAGATAKTSAIVPTTWIGPATQTILAEPPQVAERELEADREEKEDDAELGEGLDDLRRRDEAEAERPEQRSRQEETR